jgi:hypothetical protein
VIGAKEPAVVSRASALMRAIFRKTDLKPLAIGVGAAAATGLLLGAAMQPDLREPAEAEGPQMLTGVSGAREAPVYAAGGAGAYQGPVPDYVLGTDWLKAQQAEAPEAAPTDEVEVVCPDDYEDAEPIAVVRWEEPPRQPPHYPSMHGGVAYGVAYGGELPPPPPPPEDTNLVEMAAATPG